MDSNWLENIKTLISALQNEADKSSHDLIKIYELMHVSAKNLSLLLMHVSYLEAKIQELEKDGRS